MISKSVLAQIKAKLAEAFGYRFQGVILYGSEARNQAQPDSDIDLLVLLSKPTDHCRDSWTCINALYSIVLEQERPIHCHPIDSDIYEKQEAPLYQHAKQEGILL